MARTRRASRRQRGGFLDWLFGEKKNAPANTGANSSANTSANSSANSMNAPEASANVATPVGGRRKSRAHRKASRKSPKTHRKASRKANRKNRKASRRH